jgi:hypothetical protein
MSMSCKPETEIELITTHGMKAVQAVLEFSSASTIALIQQRDTEDRIRNTLEASIRAAESNNATLKGICNKQARLIASMDERLREVLAEMERLKGGVNDTTLLAWSQSHIAVTLERLTSELRKYVDGLGNPANRGVGAMEPAMEQEREWPIHQEGAGS